MNIKPDAADSRMIPQTPIPNSCKLEKLEKINAICASIAKSCHQSLLRGGKEGSMAKATMAAIAAYKDSLNGNGYCDNDGAKGGCPRDVLLESMSDSIILAFDRRNNYENM